jgi:hypothetical protein
MVFLSAASDAGVTWSMSFPDASKYEFGDQGSILVTIGDEEPTDFIKYSFDSGKTWKEYKFGLVLRALLLTTIPDSTSQKFLLLGSVPKREAGSSDRHAAVFLDFAALRTKQCQEKDFERWYARPEGAECLMGHKVRFSFAIFDCQWMEISAQLTRTGLACDYSNGTSDESSMLTATSAISSTTRSERRRTVRARISTSNGAISFSPSPTSLYLLLCVPPCSIVLNPLLPLAVL